MNWRRSGPFIGAAGMVVALPAVAKVVWFAVVVAGGAWWGWLA